MSVFSRQLNPEAPPFQPLSHHLPAIAFPHHLPFPYHNQHQNFFPWPATQYYNYGQNGYYARFINNLFVDQPPILGGFQSNPPNYQPQEVVGFQSPPPTSQLQDQVVGFQSPPPPSSPPQEMTRYNDDTSRVCVRRPNKQGFRRGGVFGKSKRYFHASSSVCNNNNHTKRIRGGSGRDYKHRVIEMKADEPKTTIMIKNIPYSFRDKLIRCLDYHCRAMNEEAVEDIEGSSLSAYDLLYLPIDFRTKQSRGFAFVNFTNPKGAQRFYDSFHNQREFFGKIIPRGINIVCAKLQGKESLVNHFGKSTYETETDEYLAVCFSPARDGSRRAVTQTTLGILSKKTREAHRGRY